MHQWHRDVPQFHRIYQQKDKTPVGNVVGRAFRCPAFLLPDAFPCEFVVKSTTDSIDTPGACATVCFASNQDHTERAMKPQNYRGNNETRQSDYQAIQAR
jgi:hypothetical protein